MIIPIKCDRCGRPVCMDDPHQQVQMIKRRGLTDRVYLQ